MWFGELVLQTSFNDGSSGKTDHLSEREEAVEENFPPVRHRRVYTKYFGGDAREWWHRHRRRLRSIRSPGRAYFLPDRGCASQTPAPPFCPPT